VKMHFKPLVRVVRFSALGPFKVQVPVHLAFGASHYRACVDHLPILAARGTSTGPLSVCGPVAEESPRGQVGSRKPIGYRTDRVSHPPAETPPGTDLKTSELG
jgi:hypothetical protein